MAFKLRNKSVATIVKELRKAGFYRATEKTLNSILKRLNKV